MIVILRVRLAVARQYAKLTRNPCRSGGGTAWCSQNLDKPLINCYSIEWNAGKDEINKPKNQCTEGVESALCALRTADLRATTQLLHLPVRALPGLI